MKRVNEILNDPMYKSIIGRIESMEENRLLCKHSLNHSLDVARIAYLLRLEEDLPFDKELIYTAALLHDIGRAKESATDHAVASAEEAIYFLKKHNYSPEESHIIASAIRSHRECGTRNSFEDLIYRADKLSRLCSACPSREECYWPVEQKNKDLLL